MSSELSTVIENAIKTARSGIRVSGIASVSDYDAEKQTVTATPLLKEEFSVLGVRFRVDIEPIEGVPVLWLGFSRGLSMGLDDGERVLLVHRTQSHDEIDNNDSDGSASLSRKTSWGDVVAIPGYCSPGSGEGKGRADGAPVLTMKGVDVFYIGDKDASKALALATETAQDLQALKLAINTHTHVVTSFSSPSATGLPQVGALSDIASQDIKVRK